MNNRKEVNCDGKLAIIKLLYVFPNGPMTDIYVNGNMILKNLEYKFLSPCLKFPPGSYVFEVFVSRNKQVPILNCKINLSSGEKSLIAIVDTYEQIEFVSIPLPHHIPTHEACIGFTNLSVGSPPLSLFVKNGDCTFPNVPYLQGSRHLFISPMKIDFQLRESYGSQVIAEILDNYFEANCSYTIFSIGHYNECPATEICIVRNP